VEYVIFGEHLNATVMKQAIFPKIEAWDASRR
jgi:hypothetical protein